MIIISAVIALLVMIVVLAPLWSKGSGGNRLQAAASVTSQQRLTAEKQALVERYLDDELQFNQGKFNQLIWEQRRQFLINRYIDASRRLDYLRQQGLGDSP